MEIYKLSQIPETLLDTVGGKARGLYLLNQFSFRVPQGFILCDIAKEEDFERAYSYYEQENLGEVAVRSSATVEDGANYSNAGQYETFLNVQGRQKFINAVKDCISSLGNFRSQKYSKTFLNSDGNKMTVVVQKMVNAKCAGVLFTQDPLDKSFVLVECVQGLGESLVSGEKSAEQYRINQTQTQKPENPTLTDGQIKELYHAALNAEKLFGKPMDLEWAIDEEGVLQFLQARPITVVEEDDVTINEFDFPHDVTDKTITTCNVREMLPTAVTPLSLSTSVYCLDWGMRKMMESNHSIKHVDDLPPFSCITPFYNSMFFNMSTNYINAYRVAGTCKETSDIVICGRVLEEFPDKFADYSPQIKRVFNMIYFLPYIFSAKKAKKGIEEAIAKLNFNYDDDLEGLYRQTNENFHLLQDCFFYHYCASYFSGATSMLAVRSISKYHKDVDALLSGALTNVEGIESASIIVMMQDLAGKILQAEPNAARFSAQELADYLSTATGEVKACYEQFIKTHGHRGISETEMRVNCWADDLLAFSETLKGVVSSYGKVEKKTVKEWTDYLAEILAPVKKSQRKQIEGLVIKARSGAWHREFTKSRIILSVSRYRRAYRLMAEKMVAQSLLPDTDLIYFLTQEEIGKLIAGDKSLVKKAMKRRRLYPVQCSLKFEEVYCGKPVPVKEERNIEGDVELQGLPASPGLVEGRARIVRSVEDANKLKEGEIMVAACTDVGWTPYYCLAAGLITEIGSCLSHGVVVAREYGLPTVVNARSAMNLICDGDSVTMDGSTGKIFVKRN